MSDEEATLTVFEGWLDHFRDYGYLEWLSEDEFRRMWDEVSGDHREFIRAVVRCKNDECVAYRCVNGCCVVLWHPHFGNTGGMGPAGCSCDDMEDPRGEKIETEDADSPQDAE